jgi:hypothetical protein
MFLLTLAGRGIQSCIPVAFSAGFSCMASERVQDDRQTGEGQRHF